MPVTLARAIPYPDPAPAMQVIVVASRKGGSGKTTVAAHLAVEAGRAGAGPVGIVDLDRMHGLSRWWDARRAELPHLARPEPDLNAALELLRSSGVRLVFVDTPPAYGGAVSAAIDVCQLVLVPVQPSPDDLGAIGATVAMIEAVRRPMVFILNRTKPRVRLTGEAAINLSQHGTVAPVQIHDRSVYAGAKVDGRTAPELDPAGLAAAEMAALWSYVSTRLQSAVGAVA